MVSATLVNAFKVSISHAAPGSTRPDETVLVTTNEAYARLKAVGAGEYGVDGKVETCRAVIVGDRIYPIDVGFPLDFE